MKKSHDPIWTYLDRDKAPRFFVCQHKALTNSRKEARKKKKFRDSKLHSSAGYETKLVKRSTSRVPPHKQPPAYKKDLPTVRSFFKATRRQAKQRAQRREKRITRKIDDRFGDLSGKNQSKGGVKRGDRHILGVRPAIKVLRMEHRQDSNLVVTDGS